MDMDITQLRAKIINKELPNFMVFIGEEWAVQKIYINQIATVLNQKLRYVDTVQEILPKLGNMSLFGSSNAMYVVRDDTKFVSDTKQQERVQELLGKSTLILLISKPDKRLKFYNTYKNAIYEFDALNPQILKKYIHKEINLNDENTNKLIEICEGNYGRILLEIDKINHYITAVEYKYPDKSRYDQAFEVLLNDGTIYIPPKDAVFDMIDAILDRKVNEVYEQYENCKGVNESSFVILTNLFNNAKALLQVQTCTNKDIAKSTGLNGWQIKNAKKHLHKYSNAELMYMLELINKCSQGIKTGTIDEKFVVDYILVSVL